MKYILSLLFTLIVGSGVAQELIVPTPQHTDILTGEFIFDAKTVIYANDTTSRLATAELSRLLRNSALISLKTVNKQPKKNAVCYKSNTALAGEGYKLEITPHLITIEASTASGYFYATQSLLQLLPTDIYTEKAGNTQQWGVPAVKITDAPRFAYRGFMLDVSRYFLPKDKVLKVLDYMALHKLNKFHWHLTDDQGWRIEIKRYPRLTSVGASRVGSQQLFHMRPVPEQGQPATDNGFYTQEEVKEVVAYAAAHCIEVIPEIEMPAHSNAALSTYPELACSTIDHHIFALPGGNGANASAVYCAGKDTVFGFLQNVIDEVITLFPSRYIHIGGDEANKKYWRACPDCQKRMRDNNIPNEEELQSYFIRRINNYLKSKGKQLMGWDELVDSELPDNSIIYGWRGLGNSATKAAKQGHHIVLTPAKICYFIRYQGPQWFEPYTYFGNNTLEDVYQYKLEDSDITPELSPLVLGIQASMWTEFVYSWENLQYMVFPRLAALADNAWSTQPKNWTNFLQRLDHLTGIYQAKDITYATSMYNLDHQVNVRDGKLYASVSCIRPDVEIRYTTSGNYPNASSSLYTKEVQLKENEFFQAATFVGNKRVGEVLPLCPIYNKATGARVISDYSNGEVLTNGLLGSDRFTDGEYLEVYDQDFTFTIDLGRATDFKQISLGSLINAGMRACLPRQIRVEVSNDNQIYSPLTTEEYKNDAIFAVSFLKTNLLLKISKPTTARYLRFTLVNPGKCPAGHPGEGTETRVVVDEIILK
ncbi:MAG: family 20 glycosylhydrolase [Bacteroides sp.]